MTQSISGQPAPELAVPYWNCPGVGSRSPHQECRARRRPDRIRGRLRQYARQATLGPTALRPSGFPSAMRAVRRSVSIPRRWRTTAAVAHRGSLPSTSFRMISPPTSIALSERSLRTDQLSGDMSNARARSLIAIAGPRRERGHRRRSGDPARGRRDGRR
jgi:hypothetical protein